MQKRKLKTACMAVLISILAGSSVLPINASSNMAKNYTYMYDHWFEEVAMPDAYYTAAYILGVDFGTKNFNDPQGLYYKNNTIYVCDSGNNRIVEINVSENDEYTLGRIVESVIIDGEESLLSYPTDLAVGEDGDIYICDNKNSRILRLDSDYNFKYAILKPDDESIDAGATFLPSKLVVDSANRVFLQATNINKGLLEFDGNGDFTGYIGANKVQVSMVDYIWKYIATEAQRSQMELFVPTEYNNVALDHDGFLYTTTSTFEDGAINQADPVRRLNARGDDILIREATGMQGAERPPIGDEDWASVGGVNGASRFVDVIPFENDSYACVDRIRGRIFTYDLQGNMLYAFGGLGNRRGYFLNPVAAEKIGYSILILDSRSGAITRFDQTEYGQYITEAMNFYQRGRYDESAEMWDKVLLLNANYDLAYAGKGRAALRNGEYKAAMEYYKFKDYDEQYGKAFQLYRKEWMEENLSKILITLVVLYIVYRIIRFVIKVRRGLSKS